MFVEMITDDGFYTARDSARNFDSVYAPFSN